jgi:tetratricopeptide (TPR) repeat protein
LSIGEEDKIYCLLGLLDVFIPASYGEGEKKTWKRLQLELDATDAPSIIPYSRNDHFVGRESELAQLDAMLFGAKKTTMVAVIGLGGRGKSQLALELAYQTREKINNCSIFWIDASDVDSLYQSYAGIAQKLKVPGWDDEKADIKNLVRLHLSSKSVRQWLFIFDNANGNTIGSSELSTAPAADLLDYLPQSGLCSAVFTTADRDIAQRLASQNIVELGEMAPDMAERMLKSHLNTPVSRSEQQQAKLLLQELLYLPLAIVQAAAYVNTRNITLQTYRSLLLKHEGALNHSSELSDGNLQYDPKDKVATTLFISMDQIGRDNSVAADYLSLTACVHRKDIPLDLLEAPAPREREDAIEVLNSYALVTRRPAESAFDLHQLVHRYQRMWLQKQEGLDQWTEHAIERLLKLIPDNDHGSRSKWRRLIPHARNALLHSVPEQWTENRMTLAWKCAIALLSDGRYKESEELGMQVLETRKRVFGDEHPDSLVGLSDLVLTFSNQGRLKEAEEWGVQAIETMKRVLGDEHPDTLTAMGNLALTISRQGRWEEAKELEVQIMEILKRVLGNEHPDTLIAMNNLAITCQKQGQWKEAEELGVQATEMMKSVLGNERPNTSMFMDNLALSIAYQGRWEEAKELEVQVMEMMKKVLGDEHPSTLVTMNNLAMMYRSQGQSKEAEELGMQAVEMMKKMLGDEHPDTLAAMSNLAFTLKSQSRNEEAMLLMDACFQQRKRVLGDRHPSTEASLNVLTHWQRENMEAGH